MLTAFESQDICFRLKHKNGSWRYFEGTAKNLLQDSQINGILLNYRDVTIRKETEKALEESQKAFEMLSNLTFEGILLHNNGVVVDVNQSLTNIVGYTKSELIGENIFELCVLPKYHKIVYKNILKDIAKPYIVIGVKKDGTQFYAELESKVIKNENEKFRVASIKDVTAQVQAEKALKNSEQQYQDLFNNSRDGFEIAWGSGEIIDANPFLLQMLGYTIDEIKTKTWQELTSKKWKNNNIDNRNNNLFEKGYTDLFEKEYICKDGSIIPIEVQAYIIKKGHNFETSKIGSIVRNVSEQKQAKQAIKEGELKLLSLFNAMSDSVFEIDYDGKYLDIAPTKADLIFIPNNEVIGKSLYDLFPKQKADTFLSFVQNCIDSKQANIIQYTIEIENKTVWFEGRATPKTKNSVLFIARNITLNREIEAQAIENHERFKALSEATYEGIIVYDNTGICIDANVAACKMAGYTIDEMKRLYVIDFIAPESKELATQNMMRNYLHPYDAVALRKDGSTFNVELLGKSFKYKNKNSRVVAVRDITERKQKEQELVIAKEKAEESNRLKNSFLANMNHEIRTPMNGILGFTEVLKSDDLTSSQQKQYIDIVKSSGDRMLNTINNLMDISMIKSGLVKTTISEMDIQEQFSYLYSFYKPLAEEKGLVLLLNNAIPPSNNIIKCDSQKIISVLKNLINNAIKFSNKGVILFACRNKIEQAVPMIEFSVKDNGIGIPEDRQKAIFDKFVQGDIEDAEAHQGSGLGLSISKAYVEMLGGKLIVESKLNKGSKFSFTIPYQSDAKEALNNVEKPNKINTGEINRNLKILIVEDEIVVKLHLTQLVKRLSDNILFAETGKAAIDICKNNPDIDLVLMDIQMPIMDGYTATREIRKFNKDVIIIAQTAFTLDGDREKSINAGCNDYITKPIRKEILMKTISKFLR